MNPAGIPTAPAYTAVIKAGQMVFVAAQVGAVKNGKVVSVGNPEQQVREIWQHLDIALAAAGGTRNDIVATWSYITKPEYSQYVTKVRVELFPNQPPTTSKPLVVTAVHPNPDYLVSISCIAVIPPK
ncbi:MAG: Endoribonuclease [Myxococcales bacterium]|nr:Endoribonuclease [Myxococcales bacterium]